MIYPKLLEPKTVENVRRTSGGEIQIPKSTTCFNEWSGDSFAATYGNKTILNLDGEPAFAELAILRIFQNDGWNGVWVDTYRSKYRTEYWENKNGVELPADKQTLLENIYKIAGSVKGC